MSTDTTAARSARNTAKNATTTTVPEPGPDATPPLTPPKVEDLEFPHPYNFDLSRITYSTETVTPPQARIWLQASNVCNRHVRPKHVARLLAIIKRGRWQFNGMPLIFDWNGKLIEGQHRLLALIDEGVALEFLIVRGVDPKAFSTFGVMMRRTMRDAIDADPEIALADDESSAVIATAVGYAVAYIETRKFVIKLCDEDERVAYLDDNDGIRDIAKLYRGRNGLRLPGGLLAACHYLFALKSSDEANAFMRDVVRGVGLGDGDPAWRFRQYVDKIRLRRTLKTVNDAGLALIDAWNRFRRHENMTGKLRAPLTSPEIE